MIPRKIHYCWFGGKPLPKQVIECIKTWKKYLPDYEIIEWNESNFDIHINNYVEQAYNEKKWAFVSDFARIYILYNEGGIYFDTDVKVIRKLDDLIAKGNFMAFELPGSVALGLGFATNKGNTFLKELINYYSKQSFLYKDGKINTTTIVQRISEILKNKNLQNINTLQQIDDFLIYPTEFFAPYNYQTGEMKITKNTRCIHLYDGSWIDGDSLNIKLRKAYIQWGYKNLFTKFFYKVYCKVQTIFGEKK